MQSSALRSGTWIAALLALPLVGACGGGGTAARRPNVVVVVLDTTRADHLGAYGYERETAPFIARLAAESAVFDNACSSSSWTAPSTASLVTGLYPHQHGVVQGFFAQLAAEGTRASAAIELAAIPPDVQTLAELLRAHGYATFGLAANVNIGSEMGFDRGFDRFERVDGWSAREMRKRMLEWEAESPLREPFFLYLHFNDAHFPYKPHPRFLAPAADDGELARSIACYDSEIGFVDDMLANLYGELGLDGNTLLVLVSDHGEEFEDHGQRSHLFSLYRELNRIVFLVHGPSLGVRAGRVTENVSIVDVLPTVAGLLGFEPEGVVAGRSLAPLIAGEAPEREECATGLANRAVIAHRKEGERQLWAIVRGDWKMIEGPGGSELYDLRADPGEESNLAPERPEVVEGLRAELDRYRERGIRESARRTSVEVDAELLERLRSLGYVK